MMEIAGMPVGVQRKTLIVCEVGAAHNGHIENAIRIMEAAKRSGADAVKVQCFLPDTITATYDRPEFTIKDGPWKGHRLWDLYLQAHMPREWFPHLFAHAAKLEIPLFASVFSCEDVAFIQQFDPPAYKISSFELIDPILINAATMAGKPMILSTGMANWEDITAAARVFNSGAADWNTVWLHCVSSYPAKIADTNLAMLQMLRRQFSLVGFSDHTHGSEAAMMAIAMGAVMIEKHMTLSPMGGGLDDHFAIGPAEFEKFVVDCHAAMAARGNLIGGPAQAMARADEEHQPLRRSLYVRRSIRAGEAFTADNVHSIRPGAGLPPSLFSQVMGKMAAVNIPSGTPLATHLIRDWKAT